MKRGPEVLRRHRERAAPARGLRPLPLLLLLLEGCASDPLRLLLGACSLALFLTGGSAVCADALVYSLYIAYRTHQLVTSPELQWDLVRRSVLAFVKFIEAGPPQ